MDSAIGFVIILAIVIALASVFFFLTRKPKGRLKDDAMSDYAAGLNYLVSGELAMALKKLRDAVRKDTGNVDAYIKIGDILRETGHAEQAAKIHRDLTARGDLEPSQRMQILRALLLDYKALKRYDPCLQIIRQINEIKKDDLWTREQELEVYQEMGDWDKAISTYKRLGKQKGGVKKAWLAKFYVEKGKKLTGNKSSKEARVAFREAIKADPEYARAYLELSDSYMNENRQGEALETLKKFIQTVPQKADLAFPRIKELLFSKGEFGDMERIYSQVIHRSPENWKAYLALSELKAKKGEIDEAIDLCQQVLQRNPEYMAAREHLIRLYHRQGKDQLAVEQALALLNMSPKG